MGVDHDGAVDGERLGAPRIEIVRREDELVFAGGRGAGRAVEHVEEEGGVGQQLGAVVAREAGDLDRQRAAAPGHQPLGVGVGGVANVLGDPQDAVAGGGRHPAAAAEGVGDRGDRHARRLGDVADVGRHQECCTG
jgi:hypothetical protein